MPTIPLPARVCVPALAILMFAAPASAQSAGGGLFDLLFAPARPVQQVAPAPAAEFDYGQARRSIRRAEHPGLRPRPKIRYAALPKSEALQIKVTDRQTPLDLKAGPMAAFLKDETLRPGDIVVTKEGAKVFVGRPDDRHTARDFESLGRSDFVDRRTRAQLTAMMLPIGAMPADQARKLMSQARKVMPVDVDQPVKTELTAMRVINPWIAVP